MRHPSLIDFNCKFAIIREQRMLKVFSFEENELVAEALVPQQLFEASLGPDYVTLFFFAERLRFFVV